MNGMLHQLCLGLFLVLPPTLLVIKLQKKKPAWWIVLTMIMGLGWLFVSGSFVFYQEHIGDLIAQKQELPVGWDSDGAAGVAALFLGWLISLIYTLPWLVVYVFIVGIRRWCQNPQAPSNDI